jgi:glycosyltransferase involved in cell wall biosynthesis
MNVLHVSTPLSWRGGEQQLAYLLEELPVSEVKQMVICPSGSAMEDYCRKKSVQHFSFKKTFLSDLFLAKQIAEVCRAHHADLVHLHDSHAHTAAVLSCLLFHNRTPLVLSRKVDFSIGGNLFSAYKYNHSSIKKIICVSEKIKEIIAPKIRNTSLLTVVHDGIDLAKFLLKNSHILRKEYRVPEDELIIANVAAIAPHKDYFTFADTAEVLLKKKFKAKFFIIGDGPEKEKIEKYIACKNLKEHIILTGFRNDIPQILPEIDIFLFTSKTEGLGSSILDAFACRAPVVATGAGGVPEIVIHEKTGLLSPVKDPNQLAENVLRLTADPNLRNTLVGNAAQFVKDFSKENTAKKTYEIYKEVLSC